MARPIDALARKPGPNAPWRKLSPSSWTIGPETSIRTAQGCVVAWTL